MTSKKTFFLLLIALVVLVAGGKFAYDKLIDRGNLPDTLQVTTPETPNQQAKPEPTPPKEEENVVDSENPDALDFTMVTSTGEKVTFSSLLGKPIVLNFWASWCPPCKLEMPYFQAAFEEMGGDDITFVLVSMTGGRETQATADAYISERGYTFPYYHDLEQEAMSTYGIYSLPTTLFISAEGKVMAYQEGALSNEMLLRGIDLIKTP